jgi:DNA-binding transcriptional regulator YhcF (GntR family)
MCTSTYSTLMLPFRIEFKTGLPVYEQVVYAAKKAIVSGQLVPGDAFPSVRTLSQELKMNPNTAHKVVVTLISEGLLEVKPGIGTMVAKAPSATRGQRSSLLNDEVERLVVEAKNLSLDLKEVLEAVKRHWNGLDKG